MSMRSVLCTLVGMLVLAGCRQGLRRTEVGASYQRVARPEVWAVLPHSPAESVGMQSGDLLLLYDQQPVRTNDDVREAQARTLGSDHDIAVVLLRGEAEVELKVPPGPLGVVPVAAKYPSSLALALEDIMFHLGRLADYDVLAALTGESFTFTAREDECRAWWPGGKAEHYLGELEELAGIELEPVYKSGEEVDPAEAIRPELLSGKSILVQGGWPSHRTGFWGVVSRYDPEADMLYGYTLDSGVELPLAGVVEQAYTVALADSWAEPRRLLGQALENALELNQVVSDTGWKSGIEAYDLLVKSLGSVPFCPICGEESDACFDRLIWAMLAHKESAIRFLELVKLALPGQVALIDEAIEDNQAIVGKLEGIIHSGLKPGRIEEQQKLGAAVAGVEIIENDLIGVYEELLGSL